MNERISELYEQAIDFTMNYHNDNSKSTQKELDRVCAMKFAELIVNECADFVRENYDHEAAESIAWTMEVKYGLHGDYA